MASSDHEMTVSSLAGFEQKTDDVTDQVQIHIDDQEPSGSNDKRDQNTVSFFFVRYET